MDLSDGQNRLGLGELAALLAEARQKIGEESRGNLPLRIAYNKVAEGLKSLISVLRGEDQDTM